MDPYLQPPGFLGTGASLLADLTLLAYIFLIVPAMLVGYAYARRGKHRPNHKYIMISITVINWVLIIFLMIVAYRFDVSENLLARPTNPRYLLPTIHGILGLIAQVLATYVVYRMLREDYLVGRALRRGERNQASFWFRSAKPTMRIVLVLWLATSLIGIFNYLFRYDVLPAVLAPAPVAAPAVTPEGTPEIEGPLSTEVAALNGTQEADAPVETAEAPVETAEAPVETAEAPVATEENSSGDDYGFSDTSTADSLDAPTATEENSSDDDYGFSDATSGSTTTEANDDHGGSGNSGRGPGEDND